MDVAGQMCMSYIYVNSIFIIESEYILQQPYAADYIGLAILIPLYICLQLFVFDEPFHRMFALDDRRIQYPHAEKEHVPVGAFT